MAYFLAQTPLQLLNCYEAKLRYHLHEQSQLLLFVDSEINRQLMKNIVSLFPLENLEIIELPLTPLGKLQLIFRLPRWVANAKPSQTFYTGTMAAWASYIVNRVGFQRVVLVDDGTKTIVYIKDWYGAPTNKSPIAVLSKAYLNRAHFFTFYAMEMATLTSRVEQNDLSCVKNYLQAQSVCSSSLPQVGDYILFIGTDIADWFENYEQELERLVKLFPHKPILYALHRREDMAYLANLQPVLRGDIHLVRFNNILEIECLLAKRLPLLLASFKSSAVDTLLILFPTLRNVVLRVPESRLTNKMELLKLYNYYQQKNGIELLPIDQENAK
jgi:hypothetical protein